MNIKWREILIYSFLAYLFSWTYWLTALLGKNPAHPFNWLPGYGPSIGMFGPMLAAVIMRRFISKEGFKIPKETLLTSHIRGRARRSQMMETRHCASK